MIRTVLAAALLASSIAGVAQAQNTRSQSQSRATVVTEDPAADPRMSIAQVQAIAPSTVQVLLERQRERWDKPPAGVPLLNAVIAWIPKVDFAALDADWRAGTSKGPLHGAPYFLKDNIEAGGPLPTTAGSLALAGNYTVRDAPIVARLNAAGAILLGKTNLSEWANIRGEHSSSGWSAVGGLTRNPFALDRTACGSSSGSAAAVAAGLAPFAIGTETDGSITCPASVTGIVGLKPTVGLVSRTGIVPISSGQDTAGPMTLNVEDAAKVLSVIAGSDPADTATKEADARKKDYFAGLDPNALKGVKLAVMRWNTGYSRGTDAVFEEALATLRAAGAQIVDAPKIDEAPVNTAEHTVLFTELKAGLNAYLATSNALVKTRTLADIIAFNDANASTELRWFGQESFIEAEATKGLADPAYLKAKADAKRLAGPEGIDRVLKATGAVALIAPTGGPAWTIDMINGDHFTGSASTLPAVAGYPHLTVPMGRVEGLPVGLSFIGPAWSEQLILSLGYAFQEARK
ncbi:MAG: amidase [Caulobacterales bacterium]|nr:amidase [Caulobacterales bacterium]